MSETALITGASSGLGRQYARHLAHLGYDVVLVARDNARLTDLADELSVWGVRADVICADLTTPEGLSAVRAALLNSADPVDMLINNAGASLAGWFGTTDIHDEDTQLDLLVRAPMHLMDAALKAMGSRGYGSVINISSVAAYTPRGAYSAHKAWILNLSQWAHNHYADSRVRVMAVCPGFVRTEFHQRGDMNISDIPGWMWLRAPMVVQTSLRDLARGKAVSVPSLRYKVLASLARHMPPQIVQKLANRGR